VKKRGFTLLEVLIVIIIIGILAAIAVPQYMKTIERAKSAEAVTNVGTLRRAMERHWVECNANNEYIDASFEFGDAGGYLLDVDNPNDNEERKWDYSIVDSGGLQGGVLVKEFYVRAEKTTDSSYWIEIDQDGVITKSRTLGGREE